MERINAKENIVRLTEAYSNLVFSLCLKHVGDYFAAEDLTQETFLSAYQSWEQFDGTNEKAWLCRIASNKCIDFLRERARKEAVPVEAVPEQGSEKEEPLQCCLNREVEEQLERSCEALPEKYRRIARGYFLEGKTAQYIADQEGSKIKTIQTQIYRARELLKKELRSRGFP